VGGGHENNSVVIRKSGMLRKAKEEYNRKDG
jgi:hypothetical protein